MTGSEVLMLARHAKQMALVVRAKLAGGRRPQQPIEVLPGRLGDHAPGDRGIELGRETLDPLHGRATGGLGDALDFHAEARRECLRQHDDVRVARERCQQRLKSLAIGNRVLPHERLLNEGDPQ